MSYCKRTSALTLAAPFCLHAMRTTLQPPGRRNSQQSTCLASHLQRRLCCNPLNHTAAQCQTHLRSQACRSHWHTSSMLCLAMRLPRSTVGPHSIVQQSRATDDFCEGRHRSLDLSWLHVDVSEVFAVMLQGAHMQCVANNAAEAELAQQQLRNDADAAVGAAWPEGHAHQLAAMQPAPRQQALQGAHAGAPLVWCSCNIWMSAAAA